VVATYQYMRLIGYPAERITILAAYNGQRALINDVLQRRCAWNPYFGMPAKVATIDRYQGQQNDCK
jgi:intron-binding protein aquarius